MIDQRSLVTFNGTEHTLEPAGMGDMVAFERHFSLSAAVFMRATKGDLEAIRFEWIAFLVWRGLRRIGAVGTDVEFGDVFLDQLGAVEAVAADPTTAASGVDPTVPDPPTG